ncbi:Rossmann fold protein nucleotide-binding protein Smf possibly involved in DNA uptake [Rubellimicrobium mesophilum DSM 19309]|uniref:Rossmann fold protein nucleotide-binding protein Smf possibly involved in DNA uptake n=1 Tax=Rubellimicrobium mesophilum DSM 19309 TaxID=442562 RepID=A0A017HU26_9RHOB|nr:DNA-processing protein DprA [Rubellimicrobium mesophilum]EYD77840.1 Rossmann fold protein nucleotide-binding protein Smf possibly involved in DNA uptake [Rubellimicrobium mesophilum DSM 19309]
MPMPSPLPRAPVAEDERIDWLRLLRSRRVGVVTFMRLLREHGSAREALRALPAIARAAGVEDYAPCPEGVALKEYKAGTTLGARLLLRGDPAYPALLDLLPDAPPLLWALGDAGLLARPMVALVGARNASSLGLRMTRMLAEGLGQAGMVVVSGLARGIDTAAHKAALPTGTVAVMAGGVDHIYPPENEVLAEEIAAKGLRLSEHPIGMEPQARHFPARNRIVSGLCHGVVVVEAAERSGTLITARSAADQGREVLAVPGHPMDPRAAGCNLLLRDGATLVRSPEDILEALAASLARPEGLPLAEPASKADSSSRPPEVARRTARSMPPIAPTPSGDLRALILDRLGPSPLAEDQLIRDLGAGAAALAPALTDLELEGRIVRQPGGLLALAA